MTALRVRDLMSSPAYTVAPQTQLPQIEWLMRAHDIRRLPVVDGGHIVGIVTASDLRTAHSRGALLLCRPDLSDRHAPLVAAEIMSRPVVTILADAAPLDAVQLMLRHTIHALPVIGAGRLIGMLTASDLLRMIAGQPRRSQPLARPERRRPVAKRTKEERYV